jgi:hypothetical protein
MRPTTLSLVLTVFVAVQISACWRREVPVGKAIVCPGKGESIELRVLFRAQGRGSPHYPSLRSYDRLTFDSIRVPARVGDFGVGSIDLRRYEGGWPATVVSGRVTLGPDSGTIDLRVATYGSDTPEPTGEIPYTMNGPFTIELGECTSK